MATWTCLCVTLCVHCPSCFLYFFVDFILTCIVTSVLYAAVHCTGMMGKISCLCACRCGRSPWLRAGGKLQYSVHGDGWGVSFPSSLPLLGAQLTQPTGGLRRSRTLQTLSNARRTTTCWHSGLLVCLRGSQETAGSWQDQSAGESYLQVMMNTEIVVLLGSGPVHHWLFGTKDSAYET